MHIGPKGMTVSQVRLWIDYGKRCVTFLSILFIRYSLMICDLMFIFSFLKFLCNLYSHFCTFAFASQRITYRTRLYFSQNDSETNRTFRGPWNGNKLTCDGALQQLKRYDGFRSSDNSLVAEVVAHLGKGGFVKHLADKLRDSGEMSLIL